MTLAVLCTYTLPCSHGSERQAHFSKHRGERVPRARSERPKGTYEYVNARRSLSSVQWCYVLGPARARRRNYKLIWDRSLLLFPSLTSTTGARQSTLAIQHYSVNFVWLQYNMATDSMETSGARSSVNPLSIAMRGHARSLCAHYGTETGHILRVKLFCFATYFVLQNDFHLESKTV